MAVITCFCQLLDRGKYTGVIHLKIDEKTNKRQVSQKMVVGKFHSEFFLGGITETQACLLKLSREFRLKRGKTQLRGNGLERGMPTRHLNFVLPMLFSSVTHEKIFYVFHFLLLLFQLKCN